MLGRDQKSDHLSGATNRRRCKSKLLIERTSFWHIDYFEMFAKCFRGKYRQKHCLPTKKCRMFCERIPFSMICETLFTDCLHQFVLYYSHNRIRGIYCHCIVFVYIIDSHANTNVEKQVYDVTNPNTSNNEQ